MTTSRFLTSWSGGKDSCYAFMTAIDQGMTPVVLLNMLNENGKISRSHAIPAEILVQQAESLRIPIVTRPARWQEYENNFVSSLKSLKSEFNVDTAVFGDIDLQEHRDWEEKVCAAAGLSAVLPLWKRDRKKLVIEMISAGIEAYIVSCNDILGPHFLGRQINIELIPELESRGVDPCGENGEYHTLVVNAPPFNNRLDVKFGQARSHQNYWFLEMST